MTLEEKLTKIKKLAQDIKDSEQELRTLKKEVEEEVEKKSGKILTTSDSYDLLYRKLKEFHP